MDSNAEEAICKLTKNQTKKPHNPTCYKSSLPNTHYYSDFFANGEMPCFMNSYVIGRKNTNFRIDVAVGNPCIYGVLDTLFSLAVAFAVRMLNAKL
jgi:hypothetical protein